MAKELGLNRFVTEQPAYHLLDRSIERELIPLAQTYGLAHPAVVAAGRRLSHRQVPARAGVPGDSRVARDMQGPMAERTKKHFGELAFQVLDQVQEIAAEKGCTAGQLALAWCMRQPGITSPIIGPRTLDHLEDNLGAVAVEITAEDRSRLDAVSEPEQAIVPYYTSKLIDFKPPLHRW